MKFIFLYPSKDFQRNNEQSRKEGRVIVILLKRVQVL